MTAASPGPAPVTPGQAAYEAMHASRAKRSGDGDCIPWDRLDEFWDGDPGGLHREDLEAAAQAAIATSGGLIASMRAELAAVTAARDEYRDNAILHIRERDQARAERDRLAAALEGGQ